jgi:hypothetical protein
MKADNPYVGPRTFHEAEKELFFGREREARDLLSLVMSERLVLFYAQSGAGKSSLINTRLRPQLQQEKFQVLPTARVSGNVPADVGQTANIFALNLVLSLQDRPNAAEVADITLQAFLQSHFPATDEHGQDRSQILIIDQFEEIFTHHLDRWSDREDFFKQLRQAVNNIPLLWVVLSIREDYIAQLDPYARLLPGRLRTRFYMRRLSQKAALDAIQEPVSQWGRPFEPGVARRLVDDLRQVRSVREAKGQTHLGEFVEPVQLQVVCYRLWENLAHKEQPAAIITRQDVKDLGNVDTALAQFYEQVLAQTIQASGISEIILRDWFETHLITEEGTRGIVYQGPQDTAGLPNAAVKVLVDRFLLRAEIRGGGVWYELIHDRFVDPILQSNQAWRQKEPLLQMAQTWVEANRHEAHLLEGTALQQALARDWPALGPLVREFLEASQTAQRIKAENQRRREQEQREAQRQREQEHQHALALAEEQRKRAEVEAKAAARARRQAIIAVVLAIFAGLLAIVAVLLSNQANQNRQAAQAAEAKAVTNAEEAQLAKETADANARAAQVAESTAQAESIRAQANAEEARKVLAAAPTARAIAEEELQLETRVFNAEIAAQTASATIALLASTLQEVQQENDRLQSAITSQAVPSPTQQPSLPAVTSSPPPIPTAETPASPIPSPKSEETQAAQAQAERLAQTDEPQEIMDACDAQKIKDDDLRKIWDEHQKDLGCPKNDTRGGWAAEQPFENGYTFWFEIPDIIIVIIGQESSNQSKDSWQIVEKSRERSCPLSGTPPGVDSQPVSAFGAIWCAMGQENSIGWAIQPEQGVGNNLYQEFDEGLIIRGGDNLQGGQWIYLLFNDGTYERKTDQAEATTPIETPIQCESEPEGDLHDVWTEYQHRLKCPLQKTPTGGPFAEQPFSKGYMFWSAMQNTYVVTIGQDEGTWHRLKSRYWFESPSDTAAGDDKTSCDPSDAKPSELYQPERGFGRIWCAMGLENSIGWATQPEQGDENKRLQEFDKGLMLRGGDNSQGGQWVYLLFSDGTYERINPSAE